jgi:N-acetylglucosamine kinase-like BadF-type ATPase
VALIAGTGSIAYGRNAAGVTARTGGWGYLLGDEGSGYALVLAGLQAVVRAADGRGDATALTERLLGHLGLSQPQELVPAVYRSGRDRAALAALAPLILATAEEGDALAVRLMMRAADELAALVAAVVCKLGLAPQALPLALAGGVLLGSAFYRQAVLRALASVGLHADPVTLVPEPAEGALHLAYAVTGSPQGQ